MNPESPRPIAEQVILVTGATDGLGRAVAGELARRGATVLVHGRSDERGQATLREIGDSAGSDKLRWYRADLSSLGEVRGLADRLVKQEPRIDVLINNAAVGVGLPDEPRAESTDGYELRFAVNYLAPVLLTRLLADRLAASAPARVVNVSSAGQQDLDFDDVMLEHDYSGMRAYCQSKLALIMASFDDAERLSPRGVTVNALHPASLMPTKIVVPIYGDGGAPIEEGMNAVRRLAVDPDLAAVTGEYFSGTTSACARPQAYDLDARRRLADLTDRLLAPAATAPVGR